MQETVHIKLQYSPYAAHGAVKEFPLHGELYALGVFFRPGHDAPRPMLIHKRFYQTEKIGPASFRFFTWDCCCELAVDWNAITTDEHVRRAGDLFEAKVNKWLAERQAALSDRCDATFETSAEWQENHADQLAMDVTEIEIVNNRADRVRDLLAELYQGIRTEVDEDPDRDQLVIDITPETHQRIMYLAGLAPLTDPAINTQEKGS